MIGIYYLARWYSKLYRGLKLDGRQPGIGRLLSRANHDHLMEVDGLKMYFNHRVATCYIRNIAGYFNEPETHQFLRNVLDRLPAGQRVVLLDAGANIGEITIDLARNDKVERVIAFEPQPECARGCAANVALNGLDAKVKLVRKVLSSKPGRVSFRINSESPQTSGITSEAGGTEFEASTLDIEVGNFSEPAILKIDVEGAEAEVMRGGAQFIGRVRPLITFEYNADNRKRYSLDDVRGAIGPGYRLFRMRSDGRLDEELDDTWNCVAVHEQSIFWPACKNLIVTASPA